MRSAARPYPAATAPHRAAARGGRTRPFHRRAPRTRGRWRCRRSLAGRRRWGSRRPELMDRVAEGLRDLVDLLGGESQAPLIERVLVAQPVIEQRLAFDLL